MIDEIKAAGGQLVLSAADFVIDKVGTSTTVNAPTFIKNKYAGVTQIMKTRVYQKSTDSDGNEILNKWSVGDLAYCQTFNLTEGGEYDNAFNKHYWVAVSAVGTTTLSSVKYNYIDLCYGATSAGGSMHSVGYGFCNPAVGDNIALLGSLTDTDRQNAIIISAYKSPDSNVKAPSIVQYMGINDFTLNNKIYNKIAANGNLLRGDLRVTNGTSVLSITDAISASVTDVSGNLANLNVSVGAISASISDVSNNVAGLTITVNGISSTVSSYDGRLSAIEQSAGNLSLYVKDADLKTTGIDVTSGQIDLNADKTNVNGFLSVKGADNGFAVYDSSNNMRVIIDDKTMSSEQLKSTDLFTRNVNATYTSIERRFTNIGTAKTDILYYYNDGDALNSVANAICIDSASWYMTYLEGNDVRYTLGTVFDIIADVKVYQSGYESEAVTNSIKLTKTANVSGPLQQYIADRY